MIIYAYNNKSASVAALKKALDCRIIRAGSMSKFVGNPNKLILNWGNSTPHSEVDKCRVLNPPKHVDAATNKLKFFSSIKNSEVSIPPFTSDISEARQWLDEGSTIVVREKLTGHSAEGIVILDNTVDWEEYNHKLCKMYVKYIPKKSEYRVHVFQGNVIDIQKKAVRSGSRPHSYQIQNLANGFIYIREGFETPNCVKQQAIKSVKKTSLDFGAVDVIYNAHRDSAYVLEINTAPGLEGSSVNNYGRAISSYFNLPYEDVEIQVVEVDALDVVEAPAALKKKRIFRFTHDEARAALGVVVGNTDNMRVIDMELPREPEDDIV